MEEVVSGIIRARAEMSLLEEAEHKCSLHLLSQMDPRSGSPSTLWTSTLNKDLLHLTARNNFRIRLVLGCHGLESDAARFRKRRCELEVGSSTCRLCAQGIEDPTHFLATCPALERRRKELLQDLIPALDSLVPDPRPPTFKGNLT